MKTIFYSLSPIRTIRIKAPLSIIFKESGHITKTAITAGKTNGAVAESFLCLPVDYPTKIPSNGFIKIALSGFRL